MLKVFTGGQCLPLELIAITLFKPKTPKEAKCFEFTVQILHPGPLGAPRGGSAKQKFCASRIFSLYLDLFLYTPLYIYTLLFYLGVCLYPINVETAEPIRPKFFFVHTSHDPRQGELNRRRGR